MQLKIVIDFWYLLKKHKRINIADGNYGIIICLACYIGTCRKNQ